MQIEAGIAGQLHVQAVGPNGTREGVFNNTFTDAGLATISGPWENSNRITHLFLGSGRAEAPHNSVESLVLQVHEVSIRAFEVVATEVLAEHVRVHSKYVVKVSKGKDWVLREFGARFGRVASLATYALLKDSTGQLTEMAFTKEEEITFTYYLQVTYPKTFTGKVSWDTGNGVEQLDYTGQLGLGDNPSLLDWGTVFIPPYGASSSRFELRSGMSGTGVSIDPPKSTGSATFKESEGSGTARSWCCTATAFPIALNFPKPLTKTTTQTLTIDVQWRFENATSVPVPEV